MWWRFDARTKRTRTRDATPPCGSASALGLGPQLTSCPHSPQREWMTPEVLETRQVRYVQSSHRLSKREVLHA
jgi:hypothetical protein